MKKPIAPKLLLFTITLLTTSLIPVFVSFDAIAATATAKPAPGITQAAFGQVKGQPVALYTLTNKNGMTVKITNYGGIITELHVPDKNGNPGDIVLGFDNLDAYLRPNPYFGALIGRYGNRIANARFTLDGATHNLTPNNGKNHMHGGKQGFNKAVWTARVVAPSTLELTHTSNDGDEGYPGTLHVTVTYTLTDDNELKIDYRATTDKPTPVNLTNHTYFNLALDRAPAQRPTIDNHELTILADRYTEVAPGLIPTGRLPPVAGTPMDFTTPHRIGERAGADFAQLKLASAAGGYDHNWVLRSTTGKLALAATVYEPQTGRLMEVFTTEPGIQFYSGNFLNGKITGKNNITYTRRSALCLETQHFPDSPNHPSFPPTILRPGETYHSQTIYKFSVKPVK